ncbi:hypothetical protein HDU76_006701, partial [Blyttiomyces sp. JEL0837]
ISSTSSGWVGIGIGGLKMTTTSMYIGYRNTNNSYTISERESPNGHHQPVRTKTQDLVQVMVPDDGVVVDGETKLLFAFERYTYGTDDADISVSGETKFIYAMSDQVPTNPDSVDAVLKMHDTFGGFVLNVGKGGDGKSVSVDDDDDGISYVQAHAISMFLAWGVFPYFGIFVARYLKDSWGKNWYRVHVIVMIGGVLLFTCLGLIFVHLHETEEHHEDNDDDEETTGPPSYTWHRFFGTAIAFAILPLQIILGYVINYLFKSDRDAIPWQDQLHWWVGRGVVVLSIITMQLGMIVYEAPVSWIALFWIWIGAMVGLLVWGHVKFGGPVHHMIPNVMALFYNDTNEKIAPIQLGNISTGIPFEDCMLFIAILCFGSEEETAKVKERYRITKVDKCNNDQQTIIASVNVTPGRYVIKPAADGIPEISTFKGHHFRLFPLKSTKTTSTNTTSTNTTSPADAAAELQDLQLEEIAIDIARYSHFTLSLAMRDRLCVVTGDADHTIMEGAHIIPFAWKRTITTVFLTT